MTAIERSSIPAKDEDRSINFDGLSSFFDAVDIGQIRDGRANWIEPFGQKLHLCYGNKKISGWEHLDYPQWNAEVEELPYPDEYFDSVLIMHSLDHMTAGGVVNALYEIQRVLRPGGVFTNLVPHHMSTLAYECLEHHTRWGLKTWRNIFDSPTYVPLLKQEKEWKFEIGFNMIFGLEERNLVMATQLVKV